MSFNRKFLLGLGLEDEAVTKILNMHNAVLEEHTPNGEVQNKINAAMQDATKDAPAPDIKKSEDYQKLQGEFDAYKRKTEASGELQKGGVKEKFIDAVFGMLDSEKPASEQLDGIREKYEEYFDAQDTKPPEQNTATPEPQQPRPQFGAPVEGGIPKGAEGNKGLAAMWGFGGGK